MTVATRVLVAVLAPVALYACVPEGEGPLPVEFADDGAYPPGSTGLNVKFAIDPDVARKLDGPARGPFFGQAFHQEDVNSFGPTNDAVPLGDIAVDLDLAGDGSATEILFTVTPVTAMPITILGFLDTDANRDESDPQPDRGDPVTLPGDNAFDMVPHHQNVVTVFFGLLNPM